MEEVFNLKSGWNEQTRRYGRSSLTAELHGKEEGEEEGEEEEEDAGVEPEGAQDVGVVVEGGGDGDEEEEDDHDDKGEAVDDKSLELEWSALPAKDPLKSFDSEPGRCRLGEVEVAGGEEKTSRRVQEQTPFHLIVNLVDRFDWIDLFTQIDWITIELILTFLHHLYAQTPTPNVQKSINLTVTRNVSFGVFCHVL